MIYNYFMLALISCQFDCNYVQSFVPCILCGISCKGCMCEKECQDSRQSEEQEVFTGSSQEAFLQSEAYAQHMIGMRKVRTG